MRDLAVGSYQAHVTATDVVGSVAEENVEFRGNASSLVLIPLRFHNTVIFIT